ncbi:MAG: GHKL domain-containing protein [Gammaproteobacteria bacterium]|nr:GHKL domain-containing protein [Gammaproteobacteria bacterium]
MKLSINARTIIGAGLVLTVFLVLTGLALDRAFEDSALTAIQERLRGQLYLLIGETEVSESGKITLPEKSALVQLNQPDSGLYAWVYREQQPVWQSQSVISTKPHFHANLPTGEESFELLNDPKGFAMSYAIEWQVGESTIPITFTLSEDTSVFIAQISGYRQTLWGWLGGMAVLLLIAQLLVLRWGLRPLRTVANELARIEQGKQEQLISQYPAELEGLTGNLNALLTHERAQQQRYRHALADLAHSLKTPLAVLQGAIDDPETVREQAGRIHQSIDYQLQRAATAGRSGLISPILLRPIIETLTRALQKVYADKQIQFKLSISDDFTIRADLGDMTELFGNLLDNACKWCQQQIECRVEVRADKIEITLVDDGPGIPKDKIEHILLRGMRADEAVAGQGIGLAVVKEIIEAYDGQLLLSNQDNAGLRITLRFPNTPH